jgi:hypothetical protein
MSYKKVLAFDIGIKNLAFCILENGTQVLALENCNILDPVEEVHCFMCPIKASYKAGEKVFCKRHIPGNFQILEELNQKKLPTNKVLKELVKKHDLRDDTLGKSNADLLELLGKKFTFHFEQPKQKNAAKVTLEVIHDALRKFVNEKWPLFTKSTHVLLENQPAFKNPHMKSVQVLLFATLREKFLVNSETPEYHLVHAKKKVADAKKGDEGYTERKNKSEERLKELFDSDTIICGDQYKAWQNSKKRSDMADALCMCVDFT